MTEFIDEGALASYLQVDIPSGKAAFVLTLANGQVTDIVGDIDPAPARVLAITAESAARAYRNPKGLASFTKSVDDWSKTERWEAASRTGVYLTDEEKAELRGYRTDSTTTRRRSIQMSVPGYIS